MLQVSSSSYSEYTDLLFFNLIASLHTLIIPYNNVVFRNITEIRKHRLVCDVSLFPYQFYISDILHNPLLLSLLWIMCCCLYSKGKNFRANHNPLPKQLLIASRCCLYSKGKNFRANHNVNGVIVRMEDAVVYIAKVRILEQITTGICGTRYSNCCCLYSKGKNFRANHNLLLNSTSAMYAVVYIAKVRILEQITTGWRIAFGVCWLLFI